MNTLPNDKINLIEIKKGDVLYRENDSANRTYIVSKGEICSFVVNDSRVVPLYIYRKDEIVGDTGNFNKKLFSENAVALNDCEVVLIENTDIEAFLTESSNWIESILSEISNKIEYTQGTIRDHKIISSDVFEGDFSNELENFLLDSL